MTSSTQVQPTEPVPGKRKRASNPRVRTGCINCKTSHVKCDEKKPACSRCQRRRNACNYPRSRDGGRSDRTTQGLFRVLLPTEAMTAGRLHLKEPNIILMEPQEVDYFDHFRHSVITHLSHGDSEFWTRTVLRECHRNDCVRNAVVALGALARAQVECDKESQAAKTLKPRRPLFRSKLMKSAGCGSHMSSSEHYYQALTHYTKAINVFRGLVAKAKGHRSSARAVLIATMLLVSFENMQGNTVSASRLSVGTLVLLRDSIMQGKLGKDTSLSAATTSDRESSPGLAASIDDNGVQEAEVILMRNILINANHLSPLNPSARQVLFQLPVPSSFDSYPPDPREGLGVFSRAWTRCFSGCLLWYIHMRRLMLLAKNADVTSGFYVKHHRERRDVTALLEAWRTAARERIDQAGSSGERLQYMKLAACINSSFCSGMTVFDFSGKSWEDQALVISEMLALCEGIVTETGAPHDALPDHGIMHEGAMPVLSHLAQQTRHPTHRRRAMEVWRQMITSRSHWDVQATYLACKAVFDIEEAKRDPVTGDIPLSAQYYWEEGSWNEDYTSFRVVLFPKAPQVHSGTGNKAVWMPAIS